MTNKFDPRTYQDKQRIYTTVPSAHRVSRLWIWNPEAARYETPPQGKSYYANRYENDANGKRTRQYQFFVTLEEARAWQAGGSGPTRCGNDVSVESEKTEDFGPEFREIVESWKKRRFPQIAFSTRVTYEKLLRLYFDSLMDCPLRRMTAARVDQWLDELKDPDSWTMQSKKRKDFRHELSLLSTILSYYDEFFDDEEFRFPIKRNRHKKAIKLGRGGLTKPKDFPETEFLRFRDQLRKMEHGRMWAALATVQYYQAFRISEIAGLHFEDVQLDVKHPEKSRIRVVRSVCWPRLKGQLAFIQEGFKNVEANDGFKEQPMFPETFAELRLLCTEGKAGLMFSLGEKILEYRWIQKAYNTAFARAQLPYTSTHVLRHGGCRRVFNDTKGDRRIAGQLLGNTSSSSIETYAKAYSTALTELVEAQWKVFQTKDSRKARKPAIVDPDCN